MLKQPILRIALVALTMLLPALVDRAFAQSAFPDPARVRIDMDHVLKGRVNRQGDLVGMHHAPSAPKTLIVGNRAARVHIERAAGGPDEVSTARIQLLDPKTREVLLEKSSTLYPDSWTPQEIEEAIREAYASALKKRTVDNRGRWQGRTADGVRIDGYLTYDGRGIATAFPVYAPRKQGSSRR